MLIPFHLSHYCIEFHATNRSLCFAEGIVGHSGRPSLCFICLILGHQVINDTNVHSWSLSSIERPPTYPSIESNLRGSGLSRKRRVGLNKRLDLSLLSVLFHRQSAYPLIPSRKSSSTYVPLGKLQIHLSSALGSDSLVILKTSANDASSDGQVAVVAVPSSVRALLQFVNPSLSPKPLRRRIHPGIVGSLRETGGFPRESHFG